MTDVVVDCVPVGEGWRCAVRVGEGSSSTEHDVTVQASDLARLDPGAADPTDLVRRSFAFLLAREPKELILRVFELTVIGRYFPDWESSIGR